LRQLAQARDGNIFSMRHPLQQVKGGKVIPRLLYNNVGHYTCHMSATA